MEPTDVTFFETPAAFRAWLQVHGDTVEQLWVGYWKRSTGRASVTWEETVDEALCFGWIDGLRKRIDDEAYTIRFTPRRSTSIWSRRNLDRYEALSRAGRLTSAGRHVFENRVADKSGLYSFEQSKPPELSPEYRERLRADEMAWKDWESRPPGYRKQVSHWVMSAKREATRERRLTALIEDSAAGRKVKPLR